MTATALPGKASLADLGDVEVDFTVEVGRAVLPLEHALQLRQGDIIELSKLAGERFDVRLNGHLFAGGETVVVHDILCCRLTKMEEPPEAKEGA